ncbi:unnamed protein product [Cylindrotheca closterium]|uniref:Uncharacterized protein n=1 Tax=Cylindrotheca closterium TaxID=2856 RepID=A0AAD2PXK4_9STRA|nr:unnamed protein product [Cylindrotheca closterium]
MKSKKREPIVAFVACQVKMSRKPIIVVEEETEDIIPGPSRGTRTRSQLDMSSTLRSLNDSERWGDLNMPAEVFAQGCNLLRQAALGNQDGMEQILNRNPKLLGFKDYDRRQLSIRLDNIGLQCTLQHLKANSTFANISLEKARTSIEAIDGVVPLSTMLIGIVMPR